MVRLLLLRHAQTLWNAEGRWQGWADVELSPQGRENAKHVGPQLRHLGFGQIVSSDLGRTRETALLINESLGLERVDFDESLRERGVGQWSGKSSSEIDAYWPGDRRRILEDPLFTPPGGESLEQMTRRVLPAIRQIAQLSITSSCPILVVTHGGVIRNTARWLGDDCGPIDNLQGLWLSGPDADNLSQDDVFRPVNSHPNSPITSL